MSIPKIDELTPEQMRVMIAEYLGWRRAPEYDSAEPSLKAWRNPETQAVVFPHFIPNYPTDANAALTLCDWMAEKGWMWNIEKLLGEKPRAIFLDIQTGEHARAKADKPALAITRAFLIANGLVV